MIANSPLNQLLAAYRSAAVTEREKGSYFEELIRTYLRHEPTYTDLYSDVWTYADWANLQGLDKRDAGTLHRAIAVGRLHQLAAGRGN